MHLKAGSLINQLGSTALHMHALIALYTSLLLQPKESTYNRIQLHLPILVSHVAGNAFPLIFPSTPLLISFHDDLTIPMQMHPVWAPSCICPKVRTGFRSKRKCRALIRHNEHNRQWSRDHLCGHALQQRRWDISHLFFRKWHKSKNIE